MKSGLFASSEVGIIRVFGDFDAGGIERPELRGRGGLADAGDFNLNTVPDFVTHDFL